MPFLLSIESHSSLISSSKCLNIDWLLGAWNQRLPLLKYCMMAPFKISGLLWRQVHVKCMRSPCDFSLKNWALDFWENCETWYVSTSNWLLCDMSCFIRSSEQVAEVIWLCMGKMDPHKCRGETAVNLGT